MYNLLEKLNIKDNLNYFKQFLSPETCMGLNMYEYKDTQYVQLLEEDSINKKLVFKLIHHNLNKIFNDEYYDINSEVKLKYQIDENIINIYY